MTLVAAGHIAGVPVLLSDVLLSAYREGDHAPVATNDDLSRIDFAWDLKITGVMVKQVIMRPTLAMGWTGMAFAAGVFFKEMHRNLGDRPSLEDCRRAAAEFFAGYEKQDLTIIGCVVAGGRSDVFRWSGSNGQFDVADSFLEGSAKITLGEEGREFLFARDLGEADVATEHKAVGWAITNMAILLSAEFMRGMNLDHFFGGGYDVVFFESGAFRRVKSVVQMIVQVFPTSSNSEERIRTRWSDPVFWQTYDGEIRTERLRFTGLPPNPSRGRRKHEKFVFRFPCNVEAASSAKLFSEFDCGEVSQDDRRFIVIHGLLKGDDAMSQNVAVYGLPDPNISVIRNNNVLKLDFNQKIIDDLERWRDSRSPEQR